MSAPEKIVAETRTEFGKGAARRIRRADKVPAVIYGHGNDPVHITLPGHETMMALKHGGANALLALDIDGTEQLALTKDVQVDPIKRHLEHIDFVVVRKGEKVTVDVPVHVVGEAVSETLVVTENSTVQVDPIRRVLEHIDFVAVRRGEKVTVDVPIHVSGDAAPETLVVTENSTVQVEAEATNIPDRIEVSVAGAEIGTQIHASDLVLPEGTTLLTDPQSLIVNVTQQQTAEQLESELAEAEADAGIVHEESEEAVSEAAEAAADQGETAEGEAPAEGDSAE